MAVIQQIKFGKNLRPTTVEGINKINELITAVNKLDSTKIDALQTTVDNLKATVNGHTSKINTAASDITNLKATTAGHTTDIDKIKVTLYTPLAADDTKE